MRGLNKCQFIGNVGRDPEVRYSHNGQAIANIAVAVSEQWKDKNTGERREKTEWVRCSLFGKLAEICGEHVKKGTKIYVEGKLQTRKWQDKDGSDKYSTEIQVNEFLLLGAKKQQEESGGENQSAAAPAPGTGEFDQDDIPF